MATVLILDDDQDFAEVLRDNLIADGIRALLVPDAQRLERAISALHVETCLIDLMLTGERSGIEVAQELRDGGHRVPLIAFSGSFFQAELARESSLFASVLEKPFAIEDLLVAIGETLPCPHLALSS